jgi:hypothetical protein
MSKHGWAKVVLAGAAIIALAGCTGVGTASAPDVPGEAAGSTSTAATSQASGSAPGTGARQSSTAVTGTRQNAASQSFVKADSIPFPVAVGNTWVYQTTASGQTGQTTNRIISAGPGTTAYQVTMASTTAIAGTAYSAQAVYLFYPDGTIGYPVPSANGVSVSSGMIRWPDAAGLASGRAYHSVLRILDSQTGQDENANVTVQGAGTTSVSVPAGIYQASIVDTTIAAQGGGNTTTETIWIAQGIGPVEITLLIRAAGQADLTSTSELVSFTKATNVVGDGS